MAHSYEVAVRKAVVFNLDIGNTAVFDIQSSLVDATRIISCCGNK